MPPLSLPRLLLRRLSDSRLLMASIFGSIVVATMLVAAAPTYLSALERLALNLAIDVMRRPASNIVVYARHVQLTWDGVESTETAVAGSLERHIGPAYEGHERYIIVDTYMAGLPSNPLPDPSEDRPTSRAYFRYLSNLDQHVKFLEGRPAGGNGVNGQNGHAAASAGGGGEWTTVEAVVSVATASMFNLQVGDVVEVTQDLSAPNGVAAVITGIVAAINPTEDYWQQHSSIFLDPPPPEEEPLLGAETEYNPAEPPIPLFVGLEDMVDGVGRGFPGVLVDSVWFAFVAKEPLKAWSMAEVRNRLDELEAEVVGAMPGADVSTGITRILDQFERRSFFSKVPLLLLLTVMTVAVLFYLSMMVAYLVQSREADVALMRTRGAGTPQILRLYTIEGLVMIATAVVLGPFIAMGAIALAGKLPYFQAITGGEFLPVGIATAPFLAAAGAALLCLAILVVPTTLGARRGLLGRKLAASRPPRALLLHRYYADVALLALGGLVYWELRSRGHFVSGGLFQDIEVNEPLLLGPVLFMIMVAVVFMRMLPLVVRYIGGESPALVHAAAAATAVTLGPGLALRDIRGGEPAALIVPVALLVAVGAAYVVTWRVRMWRFRVAGLLAQASLVGCYLLLEPPDPDHLLFAPSLGLIALVPLQVVFWLLVAATRITPVWLLIGLRNMARNPLQYTWLVVLLVIVIGVGVLATTVGGTLERSNSERVLYDVGADFRVTGVGRWMAGDIATVKARFLRVPGVTSASPALRNIGTVGPTVTEFLAIESGEFPYMSWYRDDFSALPLSGVMLALQSHAQVYRIAIPEGSTSIGMWAKPLEEYPNMSLFLVVSNEAGAQATLRLGVLGPPEWQLMTSRIPRNLGSPLYLVAVQLYEPYFGEGQIQTNGAILVDDIHVTLGPSGAQHLLEDFEGQMSWTPIVTSALSTDRMVLTARDAYEGNRAGMYSFRGETSRGIRGFYQSPTGGPMPIVVSTAFADATETNVGDVFMIEIGAMRIPVVIRDTVRYFPTMNPEGGRFVLVDLNNLLAHLNVLAPGGGFVPNELFLSEAPAAGDAVRGAVSALVLNPAQVHDRSRQLETFRLDPLATAGWNSLALLSLVIALLTAGLGYLAYLMLFARRNLGEMAFLQSMGLSRRQMMALLGFEHLLIAAIGLGLGTWAGFQMSRLMVEPLAITETGRQVVPPFILTTDWALMGPTYLVLAGIFVAAVAVLGRSLERLDLHSITRVDG